MTLEQLCHNIKVRMHAIDSVIDNPGDPRPPTGDDYNRLWDAMLDELRAAGQPFMEEWPPVPREQARKRLVAAMTAKRDQWNAAVDAIFKTEAERRRELASFYTTLGWPCWAVLAFAQRHEDANERARALARQRLGQAAFSERLVTELRAEIEIDTNHAHFGELDNDETRS